MNPLSTLALSFLGLHVSYCAAFLHSLNNIRVPKRSSQFKLGYKYSKNHKNNRV